MSHIAFKVDKTPIAKDDPRYQQRLDSQHRLALAPGLVVGGAITGAFLALPVAVRESGFSIISLPAGVVSVLVLLGMGLMGLALIQGVWRLIPAFWLLHTSLEELPENQRLLWHTLEIGLGIMGFGLGVAIAFLLV
jgi:hypothetical protein